MDVLAVEGSPEFLPWLERNTRPFRERCRIVPLFVGPVAGVTDRGYVVTGASTGRFANETEAGQAIDDFATPQGLLTATDGYDQVLWKSDIDGLDIHVLVEHWETIDSRCDTLWFEFDPPECSATGRRCPAGRAVGESGREVHAYDNLGGASSPSSPARPWRPG